MPLYPGLLLLLVMTGCAPYIEQHYRIDLEGADIRRGSTVPSSDWGVVPYHGILIHANINAPHQSIRFEVPEGRTVRLVVMAATVEQGLDGARAGRLFTLVPQMREGPPGPLLTGSTRIRRFLFFRWREHSTFAFKAPGYLPIEGTEVILVLPGLEIDGTLYPPLRIPFRWTRTFRFVPVNA